MADYKTALNMEEEAMQSMKRSQTLKDTKHGICNPMVSHNDDKFAAKRQQIKSTGGIPDLMSFNEASKQGGINDWLAFEQSTSTTASNTQYNATIKNVMSLYDSNQAANQPFHPSVWKSPSHSSSTFLPRRCSSPFAPATPQKAPATFGYPSQGSHNFSQHATQNSTAFSNLTAFAHSRSSLSSHSSLHSAHVPLSKNLSHPASLNLFGQEPFSQTRASERNKSPMAGSPMRKNASWKQFEDGNNFNNAGHSPTNVNPKSDINFDEAFQKPNSRTSSVQTNTSSGSGGGSADPMDNIFMDWFNDQLIKGDATQSPKREVFAILPPKPPPTWVDLDPLAQSENLNFAEDMPDGIGDSTAMQNWKCENASGLQDNQNDDCVPQATQEKQISKESTILVGYDSELDHFCRVIEDLRSRFKHVDPISNPGHVVGHIMSQNQWMDEKGAQIIHEDIESTVRVSIITEGNSQPVTFECDVNASIEHIVSQALCIAYEDISLVSADDYTFKVVGRQEYLLSKSQLSAYRYVQECCKYERDVDLELVHHSKVDCSLKRTSVDDGKLNLKTDFREVLEKPNTIMTRENILVLWEAFYKEEEALMKDLEMDSSGTTPLQHQCERVIQSVKAMCCALGGIETVETTEAVKRLRAAINRPTTSPAKSPAIPVVKDLVGISSTTDAKSPFSPRHKKTQDAIDHLTKVLQDFVELYCQSHESDFYSEDSSPSKPIKVNAIPSTAVKDLYSVCIVSAHRIPKTWETTYEEFFTVCSLWHGQQRISHKLIQTPTTKPLKGFYQRLIWEKWLDFDVAVHDLPLEIVLKISIYGSTPSEEKSSPKCLVQINTPLFDTNRILKHGSHIFGMWDMATVPKAEGERHVIYHCFDDVINTESVVIHVNFSEEKWPTRVVKFPEIVGAGNNGKLPKRRHSDMLTDKQQELIKTLGKAKRMVGSLCNLSEKEKEILWQNRSVVAAPDGDEAPDLSLPLLLRCVPSWSPTAFHARDAYDLLAAWPQRPQPEESLALLTSGFPDSRVRSAAVRWLEGAGDMDIGSWMPQLVQALKWEQRHDSPLMKLVLRRAMGSIRIAQKLFWLLQENMDDLTAGGRYKALHAALMVTCGSALKKEFEKELYFLKMIHRVAEAVRDAKDSAKAALLQEDLNKVSSRIGGHRFRDPLNPAHVVNGVNVKNSSHFTSNAVPIKVAFTNSDPTGSEINVMYKVGDDLRQDALTMQLIRVMDRMWLAEGLDLKIITFECLPTGRNQGLVELVSDSRTFREIQSSYGLAGAFQDRPIAEWLQKYNPTGISYERAVENFTLSCAGYCVATYVLGICDRHNDNIMLRRTGHLFHIDFARFLGHAQMFGNIKRDRAPFVLTSDMAYVINGGDRPSSQFQEFVDICCRAFNIVRKQSHILINLLSLMLDCGIPELSGKSDLKYVYDALKPNASDKEATAMFTRLIDTSLSSSFTRLNFFIHNLAQMRFSGSGSEEERRSLSFAPELRPYREEEGLIVMATVVGYQKRYSPEKYYLYCVKIGREKTTTRTVESYVFRTFDEFEELHNKLAHACSASSLPSFPGSVIVGRSQVKNVAERRKAKLNCYLEALLKSKRNVAMHDLVYTFFHPILRDEEKEVRPSPRTPDVIGGEIKLSLHYKNSALYIMVIHCKNLSPVNGSDPDPYVKTYLLPDPSHTTKRKTKVARKTLHPTYNEMLIYRLSLSDVKRRTLKVAVWNYETLQENDFLGAICIDFSQVDVTTETTSWHKLSSSFS